MILMDLMIWRMMVGLDYDDDDDIIIGKHSLDDESIHIWLLIGN